MIRISSTFFEMDVSIHLGRKLIFERSKYDVVEDAPLCFPLGRGTHVPLHSARLTQAPPLGLTPSRLVCAHRHDNNNVRLSRSFFRSSHGDLERHPSNQSQKYVLQPHAVILQNESVSSHSVAGTVLSASTFSAMIHSLKHSAYFNFRCALERSFPSSAGAVDGSGIGGSLINRLGEV